MWLACAVSGIKFRFESKVTSLWIHADITLWLFKRSAMLRLVFSQLLCLIWSVLCTGLVYECNFDGLKLKEGLKQNLPSSIAPLTFVRQLPLSRALSHSCIVRTDRKESFLHVKAKTHGETRGKLVCLPFHTDYNVACCYYTIELKVFTITQIENGICKQLHLMDWWLRVSLLLIAWEEGI